MRSDALGFLHVRDAQVDLAHRVFRDTSVRFRLDDADVQRRSPLRVVQFVQFDAQQNISLLALAPFSGATRREPECP
jgi:hypothetical protein